MKAILIIFITIFVISFLFVRVEFQGKVVQNFGKRIILLLIFSAVITIFIGMPILYITNVLL